MIIVYFNIIIRSLCWRDLLVPLLHWSSTSAVNTFFFNSVVLAVLQYEALKWCLVYVVYSLAVNPMSLEEFKAYVSNRGVVFDLLSTEEKRVWSETFDKSRSSVPGNIHLRLQIILYLILIDCVFSSLLYILIPEIKLHLFALVLLCTL
jgi:hypothetical protein